MKVLIIGLDGATWQVFDEYLLSRCMPHLRKLKSGGVSGVLRSTEPPISPSAWTSCITGCEPYTHSVLGFKDYNFKTEKLSISSSASCSVPTMFEELSEQGYKVASVNVPWTYPCRKINGICVAGYGVPSLEVDFTWPKEFKQQLLEKIPDYAVLAEWEPIKDKRNALEDNICRVEKSFAQRVNAAGFVFEKARPDIFMVQFHETDLVQHNIWPLLDKNSRDNFSRQSARLFKMYNKLDDGIGKLLKLCDGDTIVAVVSDHGSGKMKGSIRANKLLYEWGYLRYQNHVKRMLRRLYRNISPAFADSKQQISINIKTPVDWKKSKVMMMYAALNGHLYLNVKGRNQYGTVKRGREYNQCIDDLTKRFSQVTHPETGEKLFARILRPQQLYGNDSPGLENCGDLILVPKKGFIVHQSTAIKAESVNILDEKDPTGCHYNDGIYIFKGPKIKSGIERESRIIDFAPTIYACATAKIPNYMDGKVMEDIFSDDIEFEYQSGQTIKTKQKEELPQAEQVIIQQKLSELGYMD